MKRRKLIQFPEYVNPEDLVREAEDLLEAFPTPTPPSQEEVVTFWMAANVLDSSSVKEMITTCKGAGLVYPLHVQADPYLMGRYLLRRWTNPAVRNCLLRRMHVDEKGLAEVRARHDIDDLLATIQREGFITTLYVMQVSGMGDWVEELMARLPADLVDDYRARLIYSRAAMQRYLAEPDPVPARSGRGSDRSIRRRIKSQTVQLRSLRQSLYKLNQDRKQLVARVREAGQRMGRELDELTAELASVRAEAAAAEVRYGQRKAALNQRYKETLAGLQAEAQAVMTDFTEAMAERARWSPAPLLTGRTVVVVGDEKRSDGYRALVEAMGGRMEHVGAIDKLGRIPEVVSRADVVVLMTDNAKHAARNTLLKAAGTQCLVLHCPTSGLTTFERLLRIEAAPRLVNGRPPGSGEEDRHEKRMAVCAPEVNRGRRSRNTAGSRIG